MLSTSAYTHVLAPVNYMVSILVVPPAQLSPSVVVFLMVRSCSYPQFKKQLDPIVLTYYKFKTCRALSPEKHPAPSVTRLAGKLVVANLTHPAKVYAGNAAHAGQVYDTRLVQF